MKADVLAGHDVYFVDKGTVKDGKNTFQTTGTVDDRGGFKLVTSEPSNIDSADVIMAHTMPHNEWLARNQVPVIFIVHGRPLYSFRLENASVDTKSYTYINEISHFPRVKKMLYFWPEFTPYWSTFPQEKVAALDFPIIDQIRFSPEGEKHVIGDVHKGEFNILICDSWREDVDMFEIFTGALQAARELKNIKFHLYAAESKNGNINQCWDLLVKEMRRLGAMGELCGRMCDMEKVYRSMDAVLTPHRIIVRTIAEAQSCGIPVISDQKCKVAQIGCDPHDAYSVAEAIKKFVSSDKEELRKDALQKANSYSSKLYSEEMNKIYKDIKINK
jgi:glycosyltransferase involved in cell wall biosynthesis